MVATISRTIVAFRRIASLGDDRHRKAWPPWRVVASYVGVAVACAFVPSRVRADAAGDARDLFARGRGLRLQGDCASAVAVFRRALEVYPAGLGSLRNIAECEESMAHFASARSAWLDLGHALLTTRDPKYDGWALDAEHGAMRLAPKVATLTIDVETVTADGQTASPAPYELTVNGERLSTNLVGAPLERDPGRYIVRLVAAPEGTTQERVVELASGDNRRVVLRVMVANATNPTGSPAVSVHEEHGANTMRSVAWVTVGVGGASLIGAAIALAIRQSALDELQGYCRSYATTKCAWSSGAQSAEDRGHLAATLFNVFGVVGLVGIAGGVVLLSTHRGRSQHAALVVAPVGLSAVGSF